MLRQVTREASWIFELEFAQQKLTVVSVPCDDKKLQALTDAERDVVVRVVRSESNREIAAARGTSSRTVANQLAAIYQKLGIGSRGELVAWLQGTLCRD